jgi:3-deoxy-7-phosphoheptulonate synthase
VGAGEGSGLPAAAARRALLLRPTPRTLTAPAPPPPPRPPSLDSTTGLWYDCSAHFLWCGERTRQLDGAHVEFMRGIQNPIGVKVSDKMEPSKLVSLIATLNPDNVPGRLAVVVRMGAAKLREKFPAMIEAVEEAGQVQRRARLRRRGSRACGRPAAAGGAPEAAAPRTGPQPWEPPPRPVPHPPPLLPAAPSPAVQIVTWVCDPMHGNTESCNGFKTRRYENVRAEVEAFFDVHDALGSVPGGVHLEMTGDNVTECIGGGANVSAEDLNSRYHTHCDPRLNAEQSLEMAFCECRFWGGRGCGAGATACRARDAAASRQPPAASRARSPRCCAPPRAPRRPLRRRQPPAAE